MMVFFQIKAIPNIIIGRKISCIDQIIGIKTRLEFINQIPIILKQLRIKVDPINIIEL